MGVSELVVSLALVCSCGDNVSRAVIDAPAATCNTQFGPRVPGCNCCYAAQLFAARDSTTLVPSQESIELYFERWSRAVAMEPILDGRIPQDYRLPTPSQITVYTTNTAAIAAWTQQTPTTGDLVIDGALDQLEPIEVNSFYSPPATSSDPWTFSLRSLVVRNEEVLASLLSPALTSIPPAIARPNDDGTWTWLGDTADVHFTFGWGDCFSGCAGFHQLEALIPSSGAATVYDLGGDALPPYLALAPTTLPP